MLTKSHSILVTGGAGYIGSHMVLALLKAGHKPVILDNLSRGQRNLLPDVPLIVGDVGDISLLNKIFESHTFSAVMHFASLIDVADSVIYPAKYYKNNVIASHHLLEVMLRYGVNHIIFSSSAAVYGDPSYIPIDETHLLQPINPYGRSKQIVENMIKDYARSNGLYYTILRYFNAAGIEPDSGLGEYHEPETHLIPLVLQVAKGKREHIMIYGQDYPTPDGTCIRDYIHVSDLCSAHLAAFEALISKKENKVYNLGTGIGYSVQQVIDIISQITRVPIKTVKVKRRKGDSAALIADPTLVMRELNWLPKYKDLNKIIIHCQ